MSPKAKEIKAKINKRDDTKVKASSHQRKSAKRQSTKREKIFANYVSIKGLIYKELAQLNSKKQSN